MSTTEVRADDWRAVDRLDRRRNMQLLARVIAVVVRGHFNDHVRDKLARVLEIEGQRDAAGIVRQLRHRTWCGVHEAWAAAALDDFLDAEIRRVREFMRNADAERRQEVSHARA